MSKNECRFLLTKRHPEIEPLYMDGLSDSQIDRKLNLPIGTTFRWRNENQLPPNWFNKRKVHDFACYLNKTDELLFVGPAKECAETLGYKNVASFYRVYYRFKETGNGRYAIFMLEADSEND